METMPDLCRPTRGTRHSLESALPSLLRLGVDVDRIVVASAGPGWPDGAIVTQSPEAGASLGPQTRVVLGVAGHGALESLPFPLRDVDDSVFGVDPLFALFDNPFQKLLHHLRGGGHFFALHPGDPVSARRWIEVVFQVDATRWQPERWYSVARLLTALHRVAGLTDGVRLALDVVFGMPVSSIALVSGIAPLQDGRRMALETASSRLGIDTVLGEGRVDDVRVDVCLGPVDLQSYRLHNSTAMRAERDALYALVLPAHVARRVDERWQVGDATAPLHLDDRAEAVLGVTTYLGRPKDRRAA